ncbi:MAG: hypothetical protein ABIZ80_06990 [Bryobacteraceae bacterium]
MEKFLATVPILSELTPEKLREIAPLCEERRFAPETLIFQRGAVQRGVVLNPVGECGWV